MKGSREKRRDLNQVAREAPFLKVDGRSRWRDAYQLYFSGIQKKKTYKTKWLPEEVEGVILRRL